MDRGMKASQAVSLEGLKDEETIEMHLSTYRNSCSRNPIFAAALAHEKAMIPMIKWFTHKNCFISSYSVEIADTVIREYSEAMDMNKLVLNNDSYYSQLETLMKSGCLSAKYYAMRLMMTTIMKEPSFAVKLTKSKYFASIIASIVAVDHLPLKDAENEFLVSNEKNNWTAQVDIIKPYASTSEMKKYLPRFLALLQDSSGDFIYFLVLGCVFDLEALEILLPPITKICIEILQTGVSDYYPDSTRWTNSMIILLVYLRPKKFDYPETEANKPIFEKFASFYDHVTKAGLLEAVLTATSLWTDEFQMTKKSKARAKIQQQLGLSIEDTLEGLSEMVSSSFGLLHTLIYYISIRCEDKKPLLQFSKFLDLEPSHVKNLELKSMLSQIFDKDFGKGLSQFPQTAVFVAGAKTTRYLTALEYDKKGIYVEFLPGSYKSKLSEMAEEAKKTGNRLFSDKGFGMAFEWYTVAILLAPKESSELYLYYSNRAQAAIKMAEWEKAEFDIEKSLELNPTYEKSLQRKKLILESKKK